MSPILLAALALASPPQTPARLGDREFNRVFKSRTVVANGLRIHCVVGGKGSPVLLVHGFPETWAMWRGIMPALAERHAVVAVDLPGAGDSDRPVSGYDTQAVAADLHALVRALGLGPVSVVGHDLGGMVSYAYAAAYPQETARLAILDVPVPGIGFWDELVRSPVAWHFGFHQQRPLAETLVRGKERAYVAYFVAQHERRPGAVPDAQIDLYARAARKDAMRGFFEYYRAFDQDAAQNRASAKTRLTMPVLGLGGDASMGALIVPHLRLVADDVRGGVIADAGHWLVEERPEAVLEWLLPFLDGSAPPSAHVGSASGGIVPASRGGNRAEHPLRARFAVRRGLGGFRI